MKRLWSGSIVVALACADVAMAEVVYDQVVGGSIVASPTYSCNVPGGTCPVCTATSAINGPHVSFGRTGFNGADGWGNVVATISLTANIDGNILTGSLLPSGSYFRCGLRLSGGFQTFCGSYATYTVNGAQAGSASGGGTSIQSITIPAAYAGNSTISFDFCNYFVSMGTGCGVAGSIDHRWMFHSPGPVGARTFAPGDQPPQSLGAGASLDFASSPGGVVSCTVAPGTPSEPELPDGVIPTFWELHTDMSPGSFDADLTVTYNAAEVPEGIFQAQLGMYTFDSGAGAWVPIPTDIDSVAHTATGHGIDHFSNFILASGTPPSQAFADMGGPVTVVMDTRGTCWGDVDNDGDLDVYVGSLTQTNRLFLNDGAGNFASGISLPATVVRSYAPTMADYDRDGDLDLYLGDIGAPGRLLRNDGGLTFTDVTVSPLSSSETISSSWSDIDNDGDVDLFLGGWNAGSVLLRNDGASGFVDISAGTLAAARDLESAAWCDYDNDGDRDLFLAKWVGANALYRNDGGGAFTDVTSGPLGSTSNSVGAAWGDYDNDGDFDLYVTNYYGQGNALYRNDGGGSFVSVTTPLLQSPGNGVGVAWGDYDNDGDLDLYLTNQSGSPHKLFRNEGGGVFTDATRFPVGFAAATIAPSWADIDNNGSLDLLVTGYESSPNRIFRNVLNNGNHWLEIVTRGVSSNRDGIGARVEVAAGGVTQVREVGQGCTYFTNGPMVAHFGLGASSTADQVTIRWPSGLVETLTNLSADRKITVVEGEAHLVGVGDAALEVRRTAWRSAAPNPFRSSLRASFGLATASPVQISVFDHQGRRVRTLQRWRDPAPGIYEVAWDGRDDGGRGLPVGVYFLRLQAGPISESRRIVLMK